MGGGAWAVNQHSSNSVAFAGVVDQKAAFIPATDRGKCWEMLNHILLTGLTVPPRWCHSLN